MAMARRSNVEIKAVRGMQQRATLNHTPQPRNPNPPALNPNTPSKISMATALRGNTESKEEWGEAATINPEP